jgi:hypothetical protein
VARNLYDLFKGADHNIQGLPFLIWVAVTYRIMHLENGVVSIKLARMSHNRFGNRKILCDTVSCH